MSLPAQLVRTGLPMAALLAAGHLAGAEAAAGRHGGTVAMAGAVAVEAPVAVEERGSGERGGGRDRRTRMVRPVYGGHGWYGAPWSFPHWSYGWGPYGGWGYGPAYPSADAGALDINTRPKKASVYVNGELVGRADAFDGFPRYLWMRSGSYRISLYMEGYETLERRVQIQPGVVIRFDEDLVPGTAAVPRPAPTREAEPAAAPAGEGWRRRNRNRPVTPDQRREPARLQVKVTPHDAVVYLDGRLLGSGADLASLRAPLMVDPGVHRLEVTRSGYRSDARAVETIEGENVAVDIVLQRE